MCLQTGRSQLRRYKSKKSLVSEGEATSEQNKPKSQILEFWLVREYCDKGSLMVRSPPPPPPPLPFASPLASLSCQVLQEHKMTFIVACLLAAQVPSCVQV